jgi:uncharacterized protein (TIGR02099 family)
MKSRLLKGLYHFTVYSVGVIVLLAAVIVTLVRVLLPDIGIYRSEVQAWVSRYMGFPVVFHTIDATWQGWVPELTLTDIDLLNKAGTQAITHFEKARIQIAPLATIAERQIIPRSLIISGFKLSVARRENGAISIQDIELENFDQNQTNNELAEWLFKQDEVEIQNAEIEWTDLKYKQDEPIRLTDVAFKMRNDVGRFQIDGSTSLPENYGTTMDFAFDAFGSLLTSEWSGELYLAASDIDPDNWYKNIRPPEFYLSGGTADIEVWMTWTQARLDRLQGRLQYDDFSAMVKDERALRLANLTTRFLGERTGTDGWLFNVELENLATENGVWPNTDISFTAEPAASGRYEYGTRFSYLKVGDLAPVLSNLSFMPAKAKDLLNEIAIDGELFGVFLRYNPDAPDDEQVSFAAGFDELSTNPVNNLPAFSGLTGHIEGTLTRGSVTLQDNEAGITMDGEATAIRGLTGRIRWQKDGGSWSWQSDELNVATPDLSATIAGGFLSDGAASPFLDLVVEVNDAELERVARYLPATPGFKLKPWMEHAFRSGKILSASALLRGRLGDFPYTGNDGRFQLVAELSDTTLNFSQAWPVAEALSGTVEVEGKELRAHIRNGRFYNAGLTSTDLAIPDILAGEKTVMIEGRVGGTLHDLTTFIDNSPLHHHAALGEIRKAMQSGEFDMALKLGIPLKQPGVKADVGGTIGFINSSLDAPALQLRMDAIHGKVFFTGDLISSEPLSADYLGQPVTITLSGGRTDPAHPYKVSISGTSDAPFILDRLVQYVPVNPRLLDYLHAHVSGATPWTAHLSYPQDDTVRLLKRLEITSDLKGLKIDLPEPVGKREYASAPIVIDTVLAPDALQEVRIRYKSDIACQLLLDKQAAPKLQQVLLTMNQPRAPAAGKRKFMISGRVDTLAVSEWITFLAAIAEDEDATHPVLNDIEMDLDIAHLDLFHHRYYDVTSKGRKTEWGWSFNLDSAELNGDVYYPRNGAGGKQLTLLLNRLHINGDSAAPADGSRFDPGNLPALTVEIGEFNHLGRNLGRLTMQTSKIYNGASIDSFEFRKHGLLITGNGTWLSDGGTEQSKFKINLHADEMNSMFAAFGYDPTAIKGGETDFQLIADWPGTPMEFSLAHLNGRLDMSIKKGQLLDINPAAGRLFGLLSFQTLPRRLLLDFSDLFGKGLSFDAIEGNFDISNGDAYTNNLFLSGPAANLSVTGRTGLAEKDYDQIVTVTPQVTETMPVAGAIFGPVGIGVGAAIYLVGEMFHSLNSNIEGLLQHQYTITGSWENPVVEKIKEAEVLAGG